MNTLKVTIPARTIEISRCYHTCPFFGLDGGPSPTMVCNHPSHQGYEGFGIISHPDCDNGFPKKCPLLKEQNEAK